LGVWSNSIPINFEISQTELNGPHYTELETMNLNPGFEFQQLLVSLKHVINLVMRIRDTGCHKHHDSQAELGDATVGSENGQRRPATRRHSR
jgi:hypothetical protein